jgi:hypothetical protein
MYPRHRVTATSSGASAPAPVTILIAEWWQPERVERRYRFGCGLVEGARGPGKRIDTATYQNYH